jgi:hypothetical protein
MPASLLTAHRDITLVVDAAAVSGLDPGLIAELA